MIALDPEQLVIKANELDETMGWIFWLTETARRFSTGFPLGFHPVSTGNSQLDTPPQVC
jgi:hypothetical protein